MNRPKVKTALIALLAALVVSFGFAQSTLDHYQQNGITIGTPNEIPYGWVDGGVAQGISPDVLTAVLNNLGITDIRWTVTEFGSLIPGVIANRFDIVAASQAVLPARCEQVAFSRINDSYGEGFLVLAGNPRNIHSYDDFVNNSSLRMGIVSGADQLDFAQSYGISENQLVMLNANADAPSALTAGRIDAYAATGLTVVGLADGNDRVEAATEFVDPVVEGEAVRSYGAFTFNQNSEFLDVFNQALAEFQETAQYREILTSYGLTDQDVDAALAMTTEEACTP